MPKAKPAQSTDTSWRKIKQRAVPRATTKTARVRRIRLSIRQMAVGVIILAALLVVGGGVWWWQQRAFSQWAVPDSTLRNVFFQSDGVLNEAWLRSEIDFPPGVGLMDLDLASLRRQLLSHGQIREARAELLFPDALKITVSERQPVMRIAVMDAQGQRFLYLVADDGEVYTGTHYPDAALRRLPFLDGVVLRRSGAGFQPIPQAAVLAELLITARTGWPELYADWRVVSSRDYSGHPNEEGGLVRVLTRRMGEIVFRPGAFEPQMQRLEAIASHAQQRRLGDVSLVDLSLEEPVVRLVDQSPRQPGRVR